MDQIDTNSYHVAPAPAYEANPTNPTQSPEKHSTAPAMQEAGVYGATVGQQQYSGNAYPQQPQSTAPGKQEYYSSGQQPQQQYQQTYQTAVPLANLSEAAAPVDCPVCRHRALTVVEQHSGNTTQYVRPSFSIFSLALPRPIQLYTVPVEQVRSE